MISFDKITIEGFGSISGPFFYRLGTKGINLISGKNGSGKTTLFSALTWCLYGTMLKEKGDVEPWNKGKNYRGTMVSVTFTKAGVKYEVVRCKDFKGTITDSHAKFVGGSKLYILKNGERSTIRDKRELQGEVKEILGMSYNLFKNSMAFGQKLTRLLQESGPKQKEVFDEIFETAYLAKAREKANKYYSELNKTHDELVNQKRGELGKITILRNSIKNLKEERKDKIYWVKTVTSKVEAVDVQIKNVKQDSTEVVSIAKLLEIKKGKLEKIKEALNAKFKVDFELTQQQGDKDGIEAEIKTITTNLSKKEPVCSKCNQPIKQEHREKYKKNLRSRREELNTKLTSLLESIKKNTQALESFKSSGVSQKELEDTIKKLETKLAVEKNKQPNKLVLKATRLGLEGDLKLHQRALNSVKMKLTLSRNDLKTLKNRVKELKSKIAETGLELRNYKWLVEDPLSNKGLKAYIFNSLIKSINQRLMYYEEYIGFSIEFKVDLDSANKNFNAVISKDNKQRSYNDLSGGEQQLVDVCLAFSIHDVTSKVKAMNILLMDEVFESLDLDNTELISDLLTIKARGLAVHLITHHQGLTFVSTVSNLQLTKKGHFTVAAA